MIGDKMNIKKMNRFLCILLTLLLLSSSALYASEENSSEKGYVALGDSIAYGYGLYDISADSYAALVAKELHLPLTNLAVNGMTSGGLLELLNGLIPGSTDYTAVSNAALITVSIGSNDLLSVLSSTMGPYTDLMNQAATDGGLSPENSALLEAAFTAPPTLAKFDAGVETYRANLPLIHARLRELNPDAQIVMTSFYNPYYGSAFGEFDFSSLCDDYIVRMNEVLTVGAQSMDYDIADVYPSFNTLGMTCVNMEVFSLDPHPNVVGHRAFADRILEVVSAQSFQPTPESGENSEKETESLHSPTENAGSPTKMMVYVVCIGVAILSFSVTAIISLRKNKDNPHKNYRRF